jgi:hypothetical protein
MTVLFHITISGGPVSKERRVYERLDLSTKAHIQLDDEVVEGEVKNLSISGAFVTSVRSMELNTEVELSIDDPLTENLNNLKAKVARVTDGGVGLHFKKPLYETHEK